MHLRHQALILLVLLAPLTGCARLLQSILAPQQAAMSATQSVANSAVSSAAMKAPASQLNQMNNEVGRLLGGDGADKAELARIQEALEKRMEQIGSGTSAQNNPERLQPWHPRSVPPKELTQRPGDVIGLGRQSAPTRALPPPGLVPDGIPAADLPAPIDLSPVRMKQKR